MLNENNENKNAKLQKKDNKLTKNIINIRKKTKKTIDKKVKNDKKRIDKCNKKLLKHDEEERELIVKINDFNTNGKKTIAYFIDSYHPLIDGVISVVDNYATYMAQYYNVVICCPRHKNSTYIHEKYLILPINSVFLKKQGYDCAFPKFDNDFKRYISMLKIDLIHIHSPFNIGAFGLELAKKRKIPSVSTFHSQYKQDFYSSTKSVLLSSMLTSVIINIYKKTTVTLTMNQFAINIMREYGLGKRNVEIVPNATKLTYQEFDKNYENEILEKLKINHENFNILFIGRFVEVKNVYFILNILEKLKNINSKFKMIFIGYGPEERKMKKFCAEHGLKENVIFTGKVSNDDVKSIVIKNSDLLLFPSDYDTDGIVRIECACYGVPTLCIKNTGVASGLTNNHNGFIEDYDEMSFVNRIDYLMKNKKFVKNVGENAKNEIYITWDRVGDMLRDIYERLIALKNLKKIKK